jgi:hypothetical protein
VVRSSEFLAISKWLTWAIRPIEVETAQPQDVTVRSLLTVPLQRLLALGPRLRLAVAEPDGCVAGHLLLRFNLLNLGDGPTTVRAIALRSAAHEILRCEVVPSVVVRAGARYPFMLETMTGLGSEAVDVLVERAPGEHIWVSASCLPSM